MVRVRFEWDPAKALANIGKHGVSFETATLVFSDPFAILEQDRIEGGEYRRRTLGMAGGAALLVVAHGISDGADVEVIRIKSARRAERHERRCYEDETRCI